MTPATISGEARDHTSRAVGGMASGSEPPSRRRRVRHRAAKHLGGGGLLRIRGGEYDDPAAGDPMAGDRGDAGPSVRGSRIVGYGGGDYPKSAFETPAAKRKSEAATKDYTPGACQRPVALTISERFGVGKLQEIVTVMLLRRLHRR